MRPSLSALALALVVAPAAAQDTIGVSWTPEIVQSARLKEQRKIFVSTPANYATSRERYPVLVILDAQDPFQFSAAVANARFLWTRGAVPRLIIVGIATGGPTRTRDLTPKPTGSTIADAPTGGGADAFADFITAEALPFVRNKYRTLPTTILAGHSYGGLFALYHAATRPGVFAGIIAMSPALWFNDSSVVVSYSDAIARTPTPLRIFTTSGGREPAFDITTKRFVSRLDSIKPASVALTYRHYPDDTHNLTPAMSFAEGIRFVFEQVSVANVPIARFQAGDDSATIVARVSATEDAFARNARSLGLPEVLPEPVMNSLGYNILQQARNPRLATWAFRRNVARYPESANTYDSLSDALLAQGDTAAAKSELKRAIEVATRTSDPALAGSREKLQRLDTVTQAGKAKPQ